MNTLKIYVRKDQELYGSPSTSGEIRSGTKRPYSYGDDCTKVKRNRDNGDSKEVVKSEYHPIASLTPASIGPLVKGTVTWVSPWCTYPDRNVTCMNFRLGDESGDIPGVLYAPMSEDFMKNFTLEAKIVIENARVQRLKQEFRTSKDQFQLVVNQWTKIRVEPVSPEPVEPSVPAHVTSHTTKPIEINSSSPSWTTRGKGVIAIQQTPFSNSSFLITVQAPPPNSFPSIDVASGSRTEYPAATLSGGSSIGASTCTASDRFKSINGAFSNSGLCDHGPFCSINEIQSNVKVGSTIDLIGIATQVGEPRSQLTRKGYTATVREITLRDDTCSEILLAIWGPDNSIIPPNSVLLVKKATVILYNETKRLTCLRSSVIVDPDIPEAHRLENNFASLPTVTETELPTVVAKVKTSCEVSEKKVVVLNGNLHSINDIQSKITIGTTIDVIGLVVQVEDTKIRTTRKGQNATVREVTLRDDGCSEINLAIWETEGDPLYIQVNSVLVVNNAKVILYNDKKQLTCLRVCVIVDPDIPEAHRLKNFLRYLPVFINKSRLSVAASPGLNSGTSPIEIPLVTAPLSSINKIHLEIAVGTKVDLIGLAVRVEEPISRMTRKGNSAFLREVTLTDDTCSQINLAIWGADKEISPMLPNSVLLVKNATVILYNQVKKLTCQRVCVSVDPDISQAHILRKRIQYVKPQMQKIETVAPSNVTADSTQIRTKIDEALDKSNSVKIPDVVTADQQEAYRLKNLLRSVSVCTEYARSPAAVTARTSFGQSSTEVPLLTGLLSSIDKIHSEITVGTKVDLIGFIIRMEEPKSRMTRKGHVAVLREVVLKEDSGAEINLAIWEAGRDSLPIPLESVLLVKDATVLVYNLVKKLTCQRVCVIVDPDIPEARRLKKHIEEANALGTQKIEPIILPDGIDVSRQVNMTISETPKGLETDVSDVPLCQDPIQYLVRDDVGIPESHRLKNHPRSVPNVTEKAQPMTVTVTKSEVSSNEGLFVTDRLLPIDRILSEIAVGTKVDLIGLAIRVKNPKSQMTRKGYDAFVRDVTLKDDSSSEIDLAIWESRENSSEIPLNSVLLVKNAIVIFYNEHKKLTCQRTCISIEPDIRQACELKKQIEDETQTNSLVFTERQIESSASYAKSRYTPIKKIQDELLAGSNVNILAVVTHRDPVEHLVKNDKDTYKAVFVIVDQTQRKITMTVWGPRALTLSEKQYWIVEGLNIRVNEYNGKKQLICTERLSTLNVEPKIEEVKVLREWFDDVWLKEEESYAAAAADYQSNSENTGENTHIHRRACPVPISPELATYTPIDHVHESVSKNSKINIMGIADWVTSPRRTIKKPNRIVHLREINVLDDSRKSIWVTIWGDKALVDLMHHNVVAMINVTVRVTNNVKNLVCSEGHSLLFVNPCMERTRELLDWYKGNAIDKIFVETIMPISANNVVFRKFKSGDKTSVIGVVVKIHESRYVEKKTVRLDVCRRIELIDDSEETINLLMWGEQARDFNLPEETILLVTNVRVFVKDQNRACVSTAWSHYDVDPAAPLIRDKVNRLKLWWCSYKMQRSRCPVNIPTSPAAIADSENPSPIMKIEPILENDSNESAYVETSYSSSVDGSTGDQTLQSDMNAEHLKEYLGEERQRWDFF